MTNRDPQRINELRTLIADFLKVRRDDKLDKVEDNDDAPVRREELHQQFIPIAWLEDAARRVGQIQAVTHTLKPIHPDSKGSSLFSTPQNPPALNVVGSHCLGSDFVGDVVGNAAALDVYKFLKLQHRNNTFLALVPRWPVKIPHLWPPQIPPPLTA